MSHGALSSGTLCGAPAAAARRRSGAGPRGGDARTDAGGRRRCNEALRLLHIVMDEIDITIGLNFECYTELCETE